MSRRLWLGLFLCLMHSTMVPLAGQSGAKNGEWSTYGADLGSNRYSPLDQINRTNFSNLEIAWRFKTDNLGPRPEFNLESTPLMVKGVLYAAAGTRRSVVAVDAGSGELLWKFSYNEGKRAEAAPRQLSGRGLAYWTDGRSERIIYVTPGYQMIALDARTGKRLWIFHTIPLADEYGNETWENNSWTYTGNTGVWGQISVDEELGLVYLPVEMPTGDYYGGHRPGNNLFGSSIVALDLKTGQRKWHYQFIHHDIWDWDTPCAPILVDVTVDGRSIKAVAQPTKQGFIYVFDRATGRPIWPIEERAVPKGDVPGEWYSATQPFPTKPPAFERQGVSIDDLIDFTPELRAEAVKLASLYKLGPIFTPPVVSKWEGPRAMLMLPSTTGGANWQGGSYDPDTGIMYIFSNTGITDIGLVNNPQLSDMNFIRGTAPNPNAPPPSSTAGGGGSEGGGPALNIQGLPLVKPPYGRITAIDLNKGEMVWQIAHGETPDNIRNHPALKGLKIPRTGRQGRIGTLVTKTLLIAGEGGFFTTPSGQRGAMLRAYDKANGQEVGSVYMPAPQTGSPMTYMLNGKQHIIVSIGGGGYSSEFIAFRLPN